jgi:PEP-CTERM motif
MRISMRLATIPIALLALAGPARADQIPIFNTGVDASGAPLSGGSADPHWSVFAGPDITSPAPAEVLISPNGLYAGSAESKWIWVHADGSGSTGSPYTFRLTFDLTGLNAGTATISGAWGVDNEGVILLNGATPTGTGALSLSDFDDEGNFDVLNRFSITGGFVAGVNTLDFLATDNDNPGALNVSALVGTATEGTVPEPSSLALCGLGAVALAGYARRRRRTARA